MTAATHSNPVILQRLLLGSLVFGLLCMPAAFARAATLAPSTWPATKGGTATSVSQALQPALFAALAKDAGSGHDIDRAGCAVVSTQNLRGCFTLNGAHFSALGDTSVALRLHAFGRGDRLRAVGAVPPSTASNHVRYAHGAITEWWNVLPIGFEQGFTLSDRPDGRGDLVLVLASRVPAVRRGADLGWGDLRYGRLVVTDVSGAIVPAKLTSEGERLRITVADAGARYPLEIDPLLWVAQKVTATDGISGDNFGGSVAIAGSMAVIGAPYATVDGIAQGAAYVFTESDGIWSQAARLVASDGAADSVFGYSVATDGQTILVGANSATIGGNGSQGAAYVFTESGGSWGEVQKLVASDGAANDLFGVSTAIEGATAMVGAHHAKIDDNLGQGAVYVFTNTGGLWSETQKLVSSDGDFFGFFGWTLSMDGSTAVIGAPDEDTNGNEDQGAAYVFTESGGAWNETQKLVADDGGVTDNFGYSVFVSGTRALVGANFARVDEQSHAGAAYFFEATGTAWTQTQKLLASDGGAFGEFGTTVAFDGDTAFIGAAGIAAIYAFTEGGGTWTQTQRLDSGSGEFDYFGSRVAFDGTTAVAGASFSTIGGNPGQGAAYFYTESDETTPPQVSKAFSPPSVTVDEPSVATITLANPGIVAAVLSADLIDTLPSGLVATSAETTCVGSASFTAGTIVLAAGATIPAGGTCNVTATVQGAIAGNYVNVIPPGDLQTDQGSNVKAASATLAVMAPPPVAQIAPASLSFMLEPGSIGTQPLNLANVGAGELVFSISEGAAAAREPTSYRTAQALSRFADPLAVYAAASHTSNSTAGVGHAPPRAIVLGGTTIAQMDDNTPGGTGVSCGVEGTNTQDNSWWRRFYFNEHPAVGASANITDVTISSDGNGPPADLPLTINLYTLDHATPMDTIPTASLVPIGSATGVVPGNKQVTVTIPVTGTVSDTVSQDLVVEWHTNGYDDGQFFPGANASPETHPTFLSSASCGLSEPTPAANVGPGFPDFHLIMIVGIDGLVPPGCENPADISWLDETPTSGSVAAGASTDVAVSADATGLAEGDYLARLCIATNDPTQPIIPVPIGLAVTAEGATDPVFCGGFENGEDGSCAPRPPSE